MPVSHDRIRADIEAIAQFTETPGKGASRPTFTHAWREARDYCAEQAIRAGCIVNIDACGNLHARPSRCQPNDVVWLSGSHIDSVPHGGDYDGVAGVVAALEVLRSAHDDNTSIPFELVIFAEEEGTTFGLGMLGSRAWVGALGTDQLGAVTNRDGHSYIVAGKEFGVDAAAIASHRPTAGSYHGFIEVHIEQGPGMSKRDERLAVVTAIAGRKQYRVTVRGVANHAGSTAMADRHDALAGAATIILQLEGLARGLLDDAVITVGRIINAPNAINVIPDRVEFTIDFRSPDEDVLAEGDQRIRDIVNHVCAKRGLTSELFATEEAPVIHLNQAVCDALAEAARGATGSEPPTTTSGALHDAAILAPHLPTAMLFIPSKDGISHNPAEFSRVEDIALAARVVYDMVSRRGADA